MTKETIDSLAVPRCAEERKLPYKEKRTCSVCRSTELQTAVDLPSLPLTGVFLEGPSSSTASYHYDQGLTVCSVCGHAQLSRCLDPAAVYDQTYFHRSSASSIARSGNDVFAEFIRSVVDDRKFRCLLEIGANDLYLIENIRDLADVAVGVDPIWKVDTSSSTEVSVLGKFIEELREGDLPCAPDLIISVQTFEHIDEPMEQLARMVDLAADGAFIFLEVPGFDALLRNTRFDQVFHQHIQYFSLASMLHLIDQLGCVYVSHTINYRYWGGALGVAFQKAQNPRASKKPSTVVPTAQAVASRYDAFQIQMRELMDQIQKCPATEIYGFGAAQMVPTLAYHMKSDLGFLKAILDDDPQRDGLYYPGISAKTMRYDPSMSLRNAATFVTAVDSARPILRRLIQLDPQHVFMPFMVL